MLYSTGYINEQPQIFFIKECLTRIMLYQLVCCSVQLHSRLLNCKPNALGTKVLNSEAAVTSKMTVYGNVTTWKRKTKTKIVSPKSLNSLLFVTFLLVIVYDPFDRIAATYQPLQSICHTLRDPNTDQHVCFMHDTQMDEPTNLFYRSRFKLIRGPF